MRSSVVVALVAALALPAAAAPARVCNLLPDTVGDTYLVAGVRGGPDEPSLDITAGDIAADARTLTTAVRVKSVVPPPTTGAPTGYTYIVVFERPESPWTLYLFATVAPGGRTSYGLAAYTFTQPQTWTPDNARVTGAVDPVRKEIRMSVPLADLRRYGSFQYGGQVHLTGAYSLRSTATGSNAVAELYGDGVYADDVEDRRPYVIGRPSCVPVGR